MDNELKEYLDKQFENVNKQLIAIRKTQLEDNGRLENYEGRLQRIERRLEDVG